MCGVDESVKSALNTRVASSEGVANFEPANKSKIINKEIKTGFQRIPCNDFDPLLLRDEDLPFGLVVASAVSE